MRLKWMDGFTKTVSVVEGTFSGIFAMERTSETVTVHHLGGGGSGVVTI